MALASSCSRIVCNTRTHVPFPRPLINHCSSSSSSSSRTSNFTVSATPKKLSKTGKFNSKNRRGSPITTREEEEEEGTLTAEFSAPIDDGFVVPELPGDKPCFWEGPQWDTFGFFIQYMWAFGVGFALIACGIAAVTYNEGATDFKQTPVYKEAAQSREFLEEPDASNSDVFESNPTEEAPSLE